MAVFNRWQPAGGRTVSYSLAQRDFDEINYFEGHVLGLLNHGLAQIDQNPGEQWLRNLVDYGDTLKAKYNPKALAARPQIEAASNWAVLASVVFAASCLELFIRRAVALSLRSDPGLLTNSAGTLDGLKAIKDGAAVPSHGAEIRKCTDGLWATRRANLQAVFGKPLPVLSAHVADLQRLQNVRNSIAHHFARASARKDVWFLYPDLAEPQPVTSLSKADLVPLLKVAQAVANEIEATAAPHIGAFETLFFWNQFLNDRGSGSVAARYAQLHKEGGYAKLLSTWHYNMAGNTLGREYSQDLIKYYNTL